MRASCMIITTYSPLSHSKIPVRLEIQYCRAVPHAAHISSATRAPMTGVPVVSPTPATMERAKMVFIISFWFGSRGRSSAARRGMLGRGRWLGYSTLMIHSYIVRDYSFSLPSFSRKGASFVCHTNCSNGVIRAHCMNT